MKVTRERISQDKAHLGGNSIHLQKHNLHCVRPVIVTLAPNSSISSSRIVSSNVICAGVRYLSTGVLDVECMHSSKCINVSRIALHMHSQPSAHQHAVKYAKGIFHASSELCCFRQAAQALSTSVRLICECLHCSEILLGAPAVLGNRVRPYESVAARQFQCDSSFQLARRTVKLQVEVIDV